MKQNSTLCYWQSTLSFNRNNVVVDDDDSKRNTYQMSQMILD